jgi:hypothetical protein
MTEPQSISASAQIETIDAAIRALSSSKAHTAAERAIYVHRLEFIRSRIVAAEARRKGGAS